MKRVYLIFAIAATLGFVLASAGYAVDYDLYKIGIPDGENPGSIAVGINNSGVVLCNWCSNGATDFRGVAVWTKNIGVNEITVRGIVDLPGGINNNNQMAVSGSNSSGNSYYGFVLNADGTTRQLNSMPGTNGLYTFGINDSGVVAGSMYVVDSTGGHTSFAAVWDSLGNPELISTEADGRSWASAINNSGLAAWNSEMYVQLDEKHWQQISKAFIWNGQSSLRLSPLNSEDLCLVYALNNLGCAVGQSGNHAVLWNADGSVTDLGIGTANDINNAGQIVGLLNDYGVVWNQDGSVTYLDSFVDNDSFCPVAINDNGQIAGDVREPPGLYMVVMLQPVPEPSSLAALIGGLGCLGIFIKRRSL